MPKNRCFVFLLAALVWILVPTAGHAQSQIAGRVTDATGGVLPGVTVEAASPVLIEGARAAITDGEGQYSIVNLRPGTYAVTFSLPGFTTLVREQLNLPADFTLTVHVQMRVGSLEETVTVTGDSPIVDVQQTQRTQVMSREVIDALPAGHNFHARGQLIPGVQGLDIGGTRTMQQTMVTVQGLAARNTTFTMDGMQVNNMNSGGQSHPYWGDEFAQELSFQTGGIDTETSHGGARVNVVPREGGNIFSGSFLADGANRDMVSSNLSDRVQAEGATSGSQVDRIYDVSWSLGGPIQRNRLWFFYSGRYSIGDTTVAGSFYPDGSPGIDDNLIWGHSARLTWQVTQKNKITAHLDKIQKYRYHEHAAGEDIATASGYWTPGNTYIGQAKWTSPVTSRILLEAGFSSSVRNYTQGAQPGLDEVRPENLRTCVVTPCLAFDANQAGSGIHPWYTGVSMADPEAIVTRWNYLAGGELGKFPQRYVLSGKLSYVTGSHAFKTGIQHSFGSHDYTRNINGDLEVEFRRGVAESVLIRNTPGLARNTLNRDLGVYAQDTWTLNRLTLTPGVRFEWFTSEVPATTIPAGRFVPARDFARIPNLPNWFDVAPRVGAAYDLTGSAKTVLKFSVGKYMEGYTTDFAETYNPSSESLTDRRDWFDCYMDVDGRRCSGANPYGTNGDRLAQDWEIGRTTVSDFGARIVNTPDADLKRPYYIQSNVGVQHQVLPGLAVTASWYRNAQKNLLTTNNLLRSLGDYEVFQVRNPLEGYQEELIAVYNLNRQKLGQVQNVDTNATSARTWVYSGYEFSWQARLPAGGTFFGGLFVDRTLTVSCDSPFNPNTFRMCDTTGANGEVEALGSVPNAGPASGFRAALPFQKQLKLAGSYSLPYGFVTGAVFRSEPGTERMITWSVPTSAFQAAGLSRTQTVTVRLNQPGSDYYDRLNLLDLSFGKRFNLPGRARWTIGANIYNALNPDSVTSRTNTFGPTLGRPLALVTSRFWRLNTRLDW
jgi:hypothetical protein